MQTQNLSLTDQKNLSNGVGQLGRRRTINEQKNLSNGRQAKNHLPPALFRITYYTENKVERHEVSATWPEDAVLLVARGLPIQVEFQEKGSTHFTPIARHLYREFAYYPDLVAQQAAIDALRNAQC